MIKFLALSSLIALTTCIPIENGVDGDPEIECGPTSITINFNTQNTFEGHVYVKVRFWKYMQDGKPHFEENTVVAHRT